jgi:NitT/TauT family transport system substrate-binding protein
VAEEWWRGVNQRKSARGRSGDGSLGKWRALLLAAAVLALCGGMLMGGGSPAGAQETGLTKVSFIPQWLPQAQFAGYYVAYEKDFYRQHHLAVRILTGGPERPASEWLAKGKANFGTLFLTDGIEKRAQGLKLVNIAQMVQRSALMLVAKKSSGIMKPEDINGKRVGLWRHEFQLQPRAFFHKYRLQVREVPQGAT